ncbi:MAG: LysM peptidoglycan-binding domain-containing protein [Rubritalea sp.]|uniref:LysM peptidoglycan-binding domain-containing protein n=1 Tax=Rubritalea sp. TaxID=2109375 RepID=UPI0032429938
MKFITLSIISIASTALVACNNQAGNPYGAPAANYSASNSTSNPYAIPQANGETGSNAPYQALPGVGSTLPPAQNPAQGNNSYVPPIVAAHDFAAPTAGSTIPHTIVKGDSLWKLARDYDTTVEAIQSANAISGNHIQLGQTIQIPNN